jgi:hypothetical protein
MLFCVYSVLFWKILRNAGAVPVMFRVSVGKMGLSFHMKVCEPHMREFSQSQTQMHLHAHIRLGSCGICFAMKLIKHEAILVTGCGGP